MNVGEIRGLVEAVILQKGWTPGRWMDSKCPSPFPHCQQLLILPPIAVFLSLASSNGSDVGAFMLEGNTSYSG